MSRAHVTEVEENLVLEALRSGWVAPAGPMLERFEREVAERVGVSSAVATSSGTAALHLALLEAGAAPGTVVVLPSMTFAATANAALYTGATPVFVDSRLEDANVDAELMLDAVRTMQDEGQRVAAAVPVDLYGRCSDYTVLEPGLRDLGVTLIEDAAEALGATHEGRSAGSFGQAGILSFNGNKIMTTSGGGMLVSNNTHLIDRARYLSTQARQSVAWYEHTEVGFNYRMSNLLAALGVGQLSRLSEMILRRREIRNMYATAFADVPQLRVLGSSSVTNDGNDNCWLTSIILDPKLGATSAEHVIAHLNRSGIEARHLWKPMQFQPLFANARTFGGHIAQHLFRFGLNLPSGSELNDDQIHRVITAVFAALEEL